MKSAVVLVAAVIVVAALGLFVYYEYQGHQKVPTGSHVYLGAVYAGQTKNTNYISSKVYFADGTNLKNNIYYVVLSVWDSNHSYDQIGVTSANGKFYSTYSYTDIVNGTIKYIFKPTWFQISPGNHQLSMYVNSGNVVFKVDSTTYTAFTGGDYFLIETTEKMGNSSFSGLTIYEEVYGFNKSLPGISYNFSEVSYGASGYPTGIVTSWITFSHNLSSNYSAYVYMKDDTVNIYNADPLTLSISVQHLISQAYLEISDLNISVPQDGTYALSLLPGNYILYFIYQGQTKSYSVSVKSNTSYTLNA